jgi:hypothetical protein
MTLIDEISNQVAKSDGGQRRSWAKRILEEESISPFLLLLLDEATAARFSWLLGDLSDLNSKFAQDILKFMLTHPVPLKDTDRVMAKQYCLCTDELEESIEAKLIEIFFESILKTKSPHEFDQVSRALLKVSKSYPELKKEYKEILELRLSQSDQKMQVKISSALKKLEQ